MHSKDTAQPGAEEIKFSASTLSSQWVLTVQEALLKCTERDAGSLSSTLPPKTAIQILDGLAKLLKTAPTVTDVRSSAKAFTERYATPR